MKREDLSEKIRELKDILGKMQDFEDHPEYLPHSSLKALHDARVAFGLDPQCEEESANEAIISAHKNLKLMKGQQLAISNMQTYTNLFSGWKNANAHIILLESFVESMISTLAPTFNPSLIDAFIAQKGFARNWMTTDDFYKGLTDANSTYWHDNIYGVSHGTSKSLIEFLEANAPRSLELVLLKFNEKSFDNLKINKTRFKFNFSTTISTPHVSVNLKCDRFNSQNSQSKNYYDKANISFVARRNNKANLSSLGDYIDFSDIDPRTDYDLRSVISEMRDDAIVYHKLLDASSDDWDDFFLIDEDNEQGLNDTVHGETEIPF